jgi:hypothetical protein
VLNKEKDEFEYFVQRLLGVGIDNEQEPKSGKIWVPYINDKREDWSFLCENNRIIAKEDEILWRLEQYLNKENAIVIKPASDSNNNSHRDRGINDLRFNEDAPIIIGGASSSNNNNNNYNYAPSSTVIFNSRAEDL